MLVIYSLVRGYSRRIEIFVSLSIILKVHFHSGDVMRVMSLIMNIIASSSASACTSDELYHEYHESHRFFVSVRRKMRELPHVRTPEIRFLVIIPSLVRSRIPFPTPFQNQSSGSTKVSCPPPFLCSAPSCPIGISTSKDPELSNFFRWRTRLINPGNSRRRI